MVRKKLRITRRGYVRKGFYKDVLPGPAVRIRRIPKTRVAPATFKVADRGKRGRTPKSQRWYPKSQIESGWRKDLPEAVRHQKLANVASKHGWRAAWNEMQGLANITTDSRTKMLARKDARWAMGRMPRGERRMMTAAARRKR